MRGWVYDRVSNGTGQCNFLGQRDKGTTGQAKSLAKGRNGPGQPKFRTGQAGIAKNRDTGQNGTEQKRTF